MAQHNKGQTLQDLSESEGRKKRKKMPDSYKALMYFLLSWNYVFALLYATRLLNFGADKFDLFARYTTGFAGIFGIALVAIAFWVYESQ